MFATFLKAAMIEPRRVEVTYQRIAITRLPQSFNGFRIVQLSDIHHSPFLSLDEIVEAVRRANELKPDLVALTGDYISHSRDYIDGCAQALGA
ncbi:MAG: metallophosphoesterase, partial [Blastocatellia bacterium]|nr:metallophosphoesterase [Blastocatellia bacterium]